MKTKIINGCWRNWILMLLAVTILQAQALAGAFGPVLVGQWPGYRGGEAIQVAAAGNYAYVATDKSSLEVFDISDPTNPQPVGGCNTRDTSVVGPFLTVSENYAYLGGMGEEGDDLVLVSGLQIIDISTPSRPKPVGSYDTKEFPVRSVAVSGNHAYVAGWSTIETNHFASLQVIDISHPANPQIVGRYDWEGFSVQVVVSENYAYVSSTDGQAVAALNVIKVIDITDPA